MIGKRNHVELYTSIPNSLKRELFTEFLVKYPTITKQQFSAWAYGKRPFPTLNGEWLYYLELLKKYDSVWSEQRLETSI